MGLQYRLRQGRRSRARGTYFPRVLQLHLGIDTTTPAGKAMFQMCGVFAEFERAMIRERVKAGLERARAQGKTLGRDDRERRRSSRGRSALHAGRARESRKSLVSSVSVSAPCGGWYTNQRLEPGISVKLGVREAVANRCRNGCSRPEAGVRGSHSELPLHADSGRWRSGYR